VRGPDTLFRVDPTYSLRRLDRQLTAVLRDVARMARCLVVCSCGRFASFALAATHLADHVALCPRGLLASTEVRLAGLTLVRVAIGRDLALALGLLALVLALCERVRVVFDADGVSDWGFAAAAGSDRDDKE
jgi:hypothetical protein